MSVVPYPGSSRMPQLAQSYVLTDEDENDLGVARAFGYVCVGGCVFFTLLLWDGDWPLVSFWAGLGLLVALAGVNGKRYFRCPSDIVLGLMLSYGGGFAGLLLAAGAWTYDILTATGAI